MTTLGDRPVTLRPPAARLLGALLHRRAGKAAAESWLGAYGRPPAGKQQAAQAAGPPLTE